MADVLEIREWLIFIYEYGFKISNFRTFFLRNRFLAIEHRYFVISYIIFFSCGPFLYKILSVKMTELWSNHRILSVTFLPSIKQNGFLMRGREMIAKFPIIMKFHIFITKIHISII